MGHSTARIGPLPPEPHRAPDASRPLRRVQAGGVLLTVLTVLACVLALQWTRPLLVPIVIGVLISYSLDPLVKRLTSWHLPHALAVTLVFLGAVTVVGVLAYSLSQQVVAVTDRLPRAAQELREIVQTE